MIPPNATQLKVLQTGAMRTRLDSSPRKTKPGRRRCAEPGCDTLLCSFNEADTCALHRGWPASPMTPMEHRDTFADLMDDDGPDRTSKNNPRLAATAEWPGAKE